MLFLLQNALCLPVKMFIMIKENCNTKSNYWSSVNIITVAEKTCSVFIFNYLTNMEIYRNIWCHQKAPHTQFEFLVIWASNE